VEGRTDEALWAEYKADRCNLFPMGGKQHVLAAIRAINERPSMHGVAAIVDPDFWLLENSQHLQMRNLLYDDLPDVELMLVTSPALEKVLRHTLSLSDLRQFAEDLRRAALNIATEYGYFRLLDARRRDFGLSFKAVRFAEVIDSPVQTLRLEHVAAQLSSRSKITKEALLQEIAQLRQDIAPTIALCRGKDVIAILAQLLHLRPELSEKEKLQTKSNELSRVLRIAYELAYFVTTQLYKRIRKWESQNRPFRIVQE